MYVYIFICVWEVGVPVHLYINVHTLIHTHLCVGVCVHI